MMQITEQRHRKLDMSEKLLETTSNPSNVSDIAADIMNVSCLTSILRRFRITCDKCRKTCREKHASEKAVT